MKNNINIIASLLSLQSDTVTSEDGKQALTEARNRVVSMQKLYAHLFQSDEYARIDLGVYLNDIIQEIIGTYADSTITIFSELEDITTEVKLAVPLGIVLNEIVVNAVKHAFSDDRKGIIEITMTKTGFGQGAAGKYRSCQTERLRPYADKKPCRLNTRLSVRGQKRRNGFHNLLLTETCLSPFLSNQPSTHLVSSLDPASIIRYFRVN